MNSILNCGGKATPWGCGHIINSEIKDVAALRDKRNFYVRKKEPKLILDDCKYLLVISAYIYKGQYEQALDVLQLRFGKPGVKKYYNDAFEYINRYMKSR